MQLKHIPHETCPTCGERTVSETRGPFSHSNGDDFESKQFGCGCVLEWTPNFQEMKQTRPCPKDLDTMARDAKRRQAKTALYDLITGLDVDVNWKEDMLSAIQYPGV